MKNVVVLTGAGISADSGLKTFRDNDGLWENHRVEEVATPEAFEANPELVYRFYNERRRQLQSGVEPNAAHKALTELENFLGDHFLLVTQNVDDLHERAGSKRILHMHGELLSAFCCHSRKRFRLHDDINSDSRCTCCEPPQAVRPDIVWFGEMPYHMQEIGEALQEADIFISIGTSGNVYPAAGFVREANHYGAHSIELNLEPSLNDTLFHESRYGRAGEIVPQFVKQFILENQ
ncbi:NAD-dependent protein deacylase [Paraneptunicella aestuarii]|uniref:Sir2 family NAD+-dependent deacetylase n=1 Tax=Paraneptunicella aestuarii TaxID=2831148 RepID=UPI001E4CC46C|nr:Sir2 family NAD+-dependent deacetylase [Paraneptunicella aestuarii]UAA37122.1 NAD-dependent protein deacylase [Paraneptunicella aestuarii]